MNYSYDYFGNMICDKSKKMVIEYDWRNMPYRFSVYDNIPTGITDWSQAQAFVESPGSYGSHREHEIKMLYDAGGNRVKKEEVVPVTVGNPDPNAGGGLVFTDGTAVYKFTDEGILESNKPVATINSNPTSGALICTYNNGTDDLTMLSVDGAKLQISNSLIENNVTSTAGDLAFQFNTANTAVLEHNTGNLLVAGTNPNRAVTSGVAYSNNAAFTYEPNGQNYDLQYANIGSEGHSLASGEYEYYIKDHLGSTRLVVTESWTINEAFDYLPYGTQMRRSPVIPVASVVREKFTGKEWDQEGGINLDYFGRRYYDPEIGVWTSCDPKHQFFNPYAYSSNPVNTIDEDGQWVQLVGVILYYGLMNVGQDYIMAQINGKPYDWRDGMVSFGVGVANGAVGKYLKVFGIGNQVVDKVLETVMKSAVQGFIGAVGDLSKQTIHNQKLSAKEFWTNFGVKAISSIIDNSFRQITGIKGPDFEGDDPNFNPIDPALRILKKKGEDELKQKIAPPQQKQKEKEEEEDPCQGDPKCGCNGEPPITINCFLVYNFV